jgi:hypothetical protein
MIQSILQSVQDVWEDHQSYSKYGVSYLIFITRHDIIDMEEDSWDRTECVEEFCDILVNHINYLDEVYPEENISELVKTQLYIELVQNSEQPYTSFKKSAQQIYAKTQTLEQTTDEKEVKEVIASTIIIAIRTLQQESSDPVDVRVQERLDSRIRGNQDQLIEAMEAKYTEHYA